MARRKSMREAVDIYQDIIPDYERMVQKRRMAYLQAIFLLELLEEKKKKQKDPP